ncbi:MAG: phosphoglycerate kinase [Kiritimatiellia bacterium]
MNKKTIRDVDFKDRRVLMRVDFNVPLQNGNVADDTRIKAALPSIRHIREQGAKSIVLMSHLGRPKGKASADMSLKPVSRRLAELLGIEVAFVPDCIGAEAEKAVEGLSGGAILLLENLRFHPEEEGKPDISRDAGDDEKAAAKKEMKEKQKAFAKELAKLGDVYVNDAFGTAHRAHASMAVVTGLFEERVAGFLLEKEIEYLGNAVANPERPFAAIIGGAKITGKIDVLMSLADKVDTLMIGGAMAYTFYLAKGLPVGSSLVEEEKVDLARETLDKIEKSGIRFFLPVDHVTARSLDKDSEHKVVGEKEIEEGWIGVDIGPETVKLYGKEISKARTVVWNGPMGCFEVEPFAAGTTETGKAIAENSKCTSIIGGGDTASAVNQAGLADSMTHISTGGGASLEFLEGKELPGVAALSDK